MSTGPTRDSKRAAERAQMVARTVEARGVRDQRVIDAIRSVPREAFVAEHQSRSAYEDHPLPIACGQTISQPYVVALMAEAASIESSDRVLEVGTGSGYGAAVLAHLASEVISVERHAALADNAQAALDESGIDNVTVIHSDGTAGHAAMAPYSAVVVTAAAPQVPTALVEQLADGGRLVMPIGREGRSQRLACMERHGDDLEERDLGAVAFVPLVKGTAEKRGD
ncbi:MAG: protein-L-isoaspartate(D-aspartate) O-methyltransferase [Microthrixaceae bacterium]